jgi:hypothetical protein
MIAMSVMCYLASLAIGGLILINRAVDSWTTDMAREVTVQVRPLEGRDMEAELARAADIIGGFDGITEVRVLGREAAAKLLEPWLGQGRLIDDLPVPRLITVGVDRRNPPDLDRLAVGTRGRGGGGEPRHPSPLAARTHPAGERGAVARARHPAAGAVLGGDPCRPGHPHGAGSQPRSRRGAVSGRRQGPFIAGAVERRFLGAGLTGSIAGRRSASPPLRR